MIENILEKFQVNRWMLDAFAQQKGIAYDPVSSDAHLVAALYFMDKGMLQASTAAIPQPHLLLGDKVQYTQILKCRVGTEHSYVLPYDEQGKPFVLSAPSRSGPCEPSENPGFYWINEGNRLSGRGGVVDSFDGEDVPLLPTFDEMRVKFVARAYSDMDLAVVRQFF